MNKWLKRNQQDQWVKKARQLGYRSRAYAKMEQIQAKHGIIKPHMNILDLGAAPGSWSQVLKQYTSGGKIIAVDLLVMPPIEGVVFYQGDIEEDSTLSAITKLNNNRLFDLVVSDIAPNTIGIKKVDHLRQLGIVETIIDILPEVLAPSGHFICKVFQGQGSSELLTQARTLFKQVKTYKPEASRPSSPEIYWIGFDYQDKG